MLNQMENNDIDKIFRDAFEKAEETPNSNIWDKIEQELETEQNVIPISKRNTWAKYAIAACTLLILGIGYRLSKNNEEIVIKDEKIALIEDKKTDINIPKDQRINDVSNDFPLEKPRTELNEISFAKEVSTAKNQETRHQALVEEVYPSEIEIEELASIDNSHELNVIQVTEIEPVKQLIENTEEIPETMYASTATESPKHSNVVTNVLNKITENIELSDSKNIRFSADDEGSIRIDIINSLVKNRFKKRK